MKFFDNITDNIKTAFDSVFKSSGSSRSLPAKQAYFPDGSWTYAGGNGFNGEKSLGEMGPPKRYRPDYLILRDRSWQAFYESDVAQTVLKKYNTWVVGVGLKLQAQPNKALLQSEGITIDAEGFSKMMECRFDGLRRSKSIDYSSMNSLDKLQHIAHKNAIIGGDILVVLRYKKGRFTVQLIDGQHVVSPSYGNELFPHVLANGNRIINGVEIDNTGQHVAYHVNKSGMIPMSIDYTIDCERIPARAGKSGLVSAFLVYGNEMRMDNIRGVPLIVSMLQKLKVLERYSDATLGSAEEREKIAYFLEHELNATGESHLLKQVTRAHDLEGARDLPTDSSGNQLANTIAATTKKQTYNLSPGATLKALESKSELYFKDFYSVHINIMCASIEMPPNVAMSDYNGNYSASRAAIKDWEHTLTVKRKDFADAFMQPIYEFVQYIEILNNKVQAPGYLMARLTGNDMVVTAYASARFVGANVPHIDPYKEVMAERAKLGTSGAAIPLTTAEAATERLDGGEYSANLEQYARELEKSIELDVVAPEPPEQEIQESDSAD